MASISKTIDKLHTFPRASDNPDSPGYRKAASYAWPGGYPIIYITNDGDVACADCCNGQNGAEFRVKDSDAIRGDGWAIDAADCYYEGPTIPCCHCGAEIDSAYGDPEE